MHGSYSILVDITGNEFVSFVKTISCFSSKSTFFHSSLSPEVPLFLPAMKVSVSFLSTNLIPVIGHSAVASDPFEVS